jgi:hypothetical protein
MSMILMLVSQALVTFAHVMSTVLGLNNDFFFLCYLYEKMKIFSLIFFLRTRFTDKMVSAASSKDELRMESKGLSN